MRLPQLCMFVRCCYAQHGGHICETPYDTLPVHAATTASCESMLIFTNTHVPQTSLEVMAVCIMQLCYSSSICSAQR